MQYAAFASSSFRSGWPASSSSRSAVRVIVRSIATLTAQANPEHDSCCCRKGKCKESSELLSHEDDWEFAPGVLHRPSELRAKLPRTHGHLRRIRRVFANAVPHSDVFRTSPSYTMFSRSVASASSVPKRQSATLSSRKSEAIIPETQTHLLNFRDKNFPHRHTSLKEIWDTFSAFRTEEDMRALDTRELLDLGGMIIRSVDGEGEVMSNPVDWGNRLDHLVLELKRRTPLESSADTLHLDCLSIVAQALQGHSDDAGTALAVLLHNELSASDHARWVLDTFKHVILSHLRRSSASRATEYYLDYRSSLRPILMKGQSATQPARLHVRLFAELSAIFRAMDSPSQYLASVKQTWDSTRIYLLGVTMIRVFCRERLAEDALEVYEELKRQNISIPYNQEHALIRALTRAERYEHANLLYLDIVPQASAEEAERRSYDATGLYLCAHQGDVERAEECFERLTARGGVLQQEMTLVMHASAVQGDAKRVEELFQGFFGERDEGSGTAVRKPNVFHYSTLINAYAVRDDVDGMNLWLGRMLEEGFIPDLATYNIVLKAVAQRDDFKTIDALLDQMRAAGVPPDVYSYSTVIKILARRRDVLGAEAMFKRMIREGITTDKVSVTTLMNAHVEAGNWRGVIRVFDYIKGAGLNDVKLSIEVFNTLLKSYVLIGAPLEVVVNIYRHLERANIKPTNRTFALLIQAACASNRMDIASRLFVEMESRGEDWTTDVEVTKEVLTIIMTAYLQQGNRGEARVIYEDMQKRGITPTAYTYASILRAYSDPNIEENVRLVQEFLDSLVSQPSEQRIWEQSMSGRESALGMLYAALINARVKNLDVETVERLYQEFIDQHKQPSVAILTLLLDAYRKIGDVENVQRVWPQIYELALERTDEVDKLLDKLDVEDKFFRSRRRGDFLCLPLSIYIDALSHAGQHIEIAHTWNRLREAGFQFDAHNWNHLVIALVRAGQPARAFELVEKVIIPYHTQSYRIMRTRAKKVTSPLVFADQQTRDEIEDEPFVRQIERSAQKRRALLERLRRRFQVDMRHRQKNDDLAAELHLMQQMSPEWNVWRPHGVTLQVLARVLHRLDSGRLIRPFAPRTRPPPPVADQNENKAAGKPDSGALNEAEGEEVEEQEEEEPIDEHPPSKEEVREARKILDQILRDHPLTVARIDKRDDQQEKKAAKSSQYHIRQARKELWEMGSERSPR